MAQIKTISGGVIAAAITPRQAREESIDLAAVLELIDFLYEGGVDGIALLGHTGEFVHFMLEDRARMLDFAVKRSRLPIVVNVSHSTLDGTIYLGQEAIASGVAAVMIMPPFFYRYAQPQVRTFCMRAAETLAKEAPVYLDATPQFANALEPETVLELLGSGLFAGIKDSSSEEASLRALLASRREAPYQIFSGDDRLFAAAQQEGADGCVSAVACAVPELMVRLNQALRAGEADRVAKLQARVIELAAQMEGFPFPAGFKEAARRRKIKSGALACPLDEAAERDLAAFGSWFDEWLPGVLRECK